jgi:carbonic anhydrase/acetyltransferase-like protein (isoleucine patch superfamily)
MKTSAAIDPSAWIAPGVVVLGNVTIGPGTSLWYGTVVRGDTEQIVIGADTNIQDLSMVHADPGFPCRVGQRVTVGHRVILHGCTVEDDCLIGMGAILLNGVTIGAGSIVGAGTVLAEGKTIPPGSLVVGVPGRVLRSVDDAARTRMEHTWRHYIDLAVRHRAGEFPRHETAGPA